MDRFEALKVVRSYPHDLRVSELYDQENAFANALNDLFPGTFEYPDYAHRKVSEVVRMAEIAYEGLFDIAAPKGQEHFEYYDPFAECKYVKKSMQEMVSVCEELRVGKFQAIRPDGKIIQVNEVDGKWEREDDPNVMRRQAEANALVLAADLEKRIRAEFKEDRHDVSRMSNDVRMAYREMGADPHEDAERGAMQGIEARSIAFVDALSTAKYALITDISGVNARLQAMREIEVMVLSADVSTIWAELDIRDFLKIQMSPHRKEDAGLILAGNAAINLAYKSALIEKNPFVAALVANFDVENERLIAAKEVRKAAEMRASDNAGYFVTRNDHSGMVGICRVDESTVTEFGGIPAIQNFAKENPEVPARIINELLARDGGYYPEIRDSGHDVILMHPDKNRVIVRDTVEELWVAAAKSAVQHFELSDFKMRCEMAGGIPVSIENPWCGDGEWKGTVALESSYYLLVSLGDNKYVAHEKAKLDGAVIEVSGDVPVGAFMHVVQKSGRFVFQKIERNNEPEYEEAECVPVCRP